MSTDLETRLRAGLADAPTPAGLALDADAVTRLASRAHRRHRTGQALLGGMASLAVLGTSLWAGGWLPDGVQQALPASPASTCPLSWGNDPDISLDAVEHAVLPLPGGGTLVAGEARGCPDGDLLFLTATTAAPDQLPATLPLQGGQGTDPEQDVRSAWMNGLQLEDGRRVTGLMVPAGATQLTVVGPDALHEPSVEPVHVPGTALDVVALEDYWPAGEDLAQVWRGADGLVHTGWSAGVTGRVWQGDDPGAHLTDTWVGEDRQDQHWVMRRGEVQGPFETTSPPHGIVFATAQASEVDVVVALPEAGGTLELADGTGLTGPVLTSHGEPASLSAVLLTLDRGPDGSLPDVLWTPDGADEPVPVPLEQG